MQCLVLYDIPDDRTRQRIADLCLDYGLARIQYSAFCGDLSAAYQRELFKGLTKRLGRKAGTIHFFALDEYSWNGRRVLTQGGSG